MLRGGDVRVKGRHPTGRPWRVTITEPPSLSALRKITKAVVTSPGGGLPHSDSLRRRPDSGNAQQDKDKEAFVMRRYESMRGRGESTGLGPSPRGAHMVSVGEGEAGASEAMASMDVSAAEEGHVLAHVPLRDGAAMTTSGDYMQVYVSSDHMYCHVFNPRAKRLLEVSPTALAQTSVVTDGSCMYTDALATTALVLGAVPRDARTFLDGLSSFAVPVEDYLLYAREGPKVIRRRLRGSEAEVAREIRLAQSEPARVVVIGGGLAGFAAAIQAAK